jgi:hypothetical protein
VKQKQQPGRVAAEILFTILEVCIRIAEQHTAKNRSLSSSPFAGIILSRFQGYYLRLFTATPKDRRKVNAINIKLPKRK